MAENHTGSGRPAGPRETGRGLSRETGRGAGQSRATTIAAADLATRLSLVTPSAVLA
jgi:hypothetical protein